VKNVTIDFILLLLMNNINSKSGMFVAQVYFAKCTLAKTDINLENCRICCNKTVGETTWLLVTDSNGVKYKK
jgi:hypothetical protein